tara:strand:+ start:1132 stop:1431 length:300 start_codon:yes stop_codon:yes gene_type:complete
MEKRLTKAVVYRATKTNKKLGYKENELFLFNEKLSNGDILGQSYEDTLFKRLIKSECVKVINYSRDFTHNEEYKINQKRKIKENGNFIERKRRNKNRSF